MQSKRLGHTGVLCSILLLCLSSLNVYAQRKEVNHKDNLVVLMVHPKDTSIVVDPLTGEEKFVVTSKSDDVLSLNREKVHRTDDGQAIEILKQAVEERISGIPKQLDKGTYNYYIETIVINKEGRVAYLQPGNIFPVRIVDLDGNDVTPQIADDVRHLLNGEIAQAIESVKMPPIEMDGEPVNAVVHLNGSFIVE
ncbi:MAG TPA: hypothetical protein VEB40_11515 [Flavipsychrobacter sp.]|nr:hypothetical protein [Flavipsychrobacter sp.]